jgi:hypothetical protein
MVESEFVLLGTEIDDSGMPWALLAQEGGELEFVGQAIFRTPSQWAEKLTPEGQRVAAPCQRDAAAHRLKKLIRLVLGS